MVESEPRRFASDAGFRFELVRRMRALAHVNAGLAYSHKTGKVRRVYREMSPKAVAILGQWLADALGGAGLHLAKLDRDDEERRKTERAKLYEALGALK